MKMKTLQNQRFIDTDLNSTSVPHVRSPASGHQETPGLFTTRIYIVNSSNASELLCRLGAGSGEDQNPMPTAC